MEHEVHVTVDGTKEAGRGIGCLALAAIPVLMVMGAISAWYGYHLNAHSIKQMGREEAAQQRADDRVGAHELPKAPIRLVLSSRSPCLEFESGYLDGGTLTGYIRNSCHRNYDYYEVHFRGIAPDGTVVVGGYENTAQLPEIDAGEKVEIHIAMPSDNRVVEVRTFVSTREW